MASIYRVGWSFAWAVSALLLAPPIAEAQFSPWWSVVPPPRSGGPYPTLIGPGWIGTLPPQPIGHRITRFPDGGYAYEPVYGQPADDANLLADDFAAEAAERFTAIEEDWLPETPDLALPEDTLVSAWQALFAAGAALRAGRTEKARQLAQQAALIAPARALADLFLAQTYLEEQNWPLAAQHLAAGLAGLDPADWRRVEHELERWSGPPAVRARQALRETVQANPQDRDALFLLGAWHAWHGAPAEAHALLAAAVNAGRDDLCVLRLLEQCRRIEPPADGPGPREFPAGRGQAL